MVIKWIRPGEHKFGKGWIVGSLNGEPAFSDGHAMFLGKRCPTKVNENERPPDFNKAFKALLPKAGLRKVRRLVNLDCEPTGLARVSLDGMLINRKYIDAALKFKGVEFYKARKAIVCKVGTKVVGAIMEMLW